MDAKNKMDSDCSSSISFEIICKCPIFECGWTGIEQSDFINHCHDKHQDRMLEENAEIFLHLEDSYSIVNFVVYEKSFFSIVWKFDENKKRLKCQVTPHEDGDRSENTFCKGFLSIKFLQKSFTFDFDADVIFTKTVPYLDLFKNIVTSSTMRASLRFQKAFEEATPNQLSIEVPLSNCSVCDIPTNKLKELNCTDFPVLPAANASTSDPNVRNLKNFCELNKSGFDKRTESLTSFIFEHLKVCEDKLVDCTILVDLTKFGHGTKTCEKMICLKHFEYHILRNHKRHVILNGTETIFPLLNDDLKFNSIFLNFGNFLFRFTMRLTEPNVIRCSVQTMNAKAPDCGFRVEILDKSKFLRGNLRRIRNCLKYQEVDSSNPTTSCFFWRGELLPYCFRDNERDKFGTKITIFKIK